MRNYIHPEQFIEDSFDFDFLKNSWNGNSLTIMKVQAFKTRTSRCLQTLSSPAKVRIKHSFVFADGKGEDEIDDYEIDATQFALKVERRKKLYAARGCTILS